MSRPLAIIETVVDGAPRRIDADKVLEVNYRMALAIGFAQLIHEGKMRLADVEAD